MLETLRKHSRSLLIYLIFGILIAVFIISFGPQSGQKGSGCSGAATRYVAKVNGKEISETTWRYGILALSESRGASGEWARRAQLRERVLDDLIVREILAQTAEALGFRVSDDEIHSQITDGDIYILGRRIPSKRWFWVKEEDDDTPRFRAKAVERLAQNFGLNTVERFKEEQRRELLAQKIRSLVMESVRVSPEEVQRAYEQRENKIDMELVAFEPGALRDGVEITPADIDDYLTKKEAEIKAQYERDQLRYKGLDKEVRVRDLLIVPDGAPPKGPDAKARAQAALAKIKAGTDFAQVVKTLSEDERYKKRGGDLGWRPLRALRLGEQVSKAVEKLDKGQVTDVIEAPDGLHIVQLVDKREGDLTFDQVKRELAEEAIRDERTKAEAKKRAEAALEKAKAGTALDKQFPDNPDAKGPRLQKQNDVERTGDRVSGVGQSKELVKALFEDAKPGELLPKVYEVAGDYFVIRLVARREADMQKFQTEKPKLQAQLARDRSLETLVFLEGVRCQQVKDQNGIQFDPEYVTYSDTDAQGKERRTMSYTPCMMYQTSGIAME